MSIKTPDVIYFNCICTIPFRSPNGVSLTVSASCGVAADVSDESFEQTRDFPLVLYNRLVELYECVGDSRSMIHGSHTIRAVSQCFIEKNVSSPGSICPLFQLTDIPADFSEYSVNLPFLSGEIFIHQHVIDIPRLRMAAYTGSAFV